MHRKAQSLPKSGNVGRVIAFMPTQKTPLSDLPAYTASQSLSRPPRRELAVHTFELKDSKGRPWLTLAVSSRAPSSACLPHFYEGDQVRGFVNLNLEKETQVKSVTVMVSDPEPYATIL